jgi:hypothetical protein
MFESSNKKTYRFIYKTNIMKKIIIASAAVLFAFAANAQVDGGVRTASQTATIIIDEVLNLAITSDDLTDFNFNEVTEYDNGITQAAATTFAVDASVPWKINFAADNTTFQSASATTMPLSVFSIGKTGSALQALTDVSSVDPLSTGARGDNALSGNTFTVDYKANPGYSYDPGTYTVGIVYTISAQ